jgi:hypothetical protein
MKKLPVCDKLINTNNELVTHQYCAPVFIASSFFGTFICDKSNLVPEELDENSVRSGTLTFLSYKNECFAITCNRVLEALESRQSSWKKRQKEKYDIEFPIDGYQLFTPIDNNQFHFNYKLTPAKKNNDCSQPDIAIARFNMHSITRLKRKPLVLAKKEKLPETGIASGYPEQQRSIKNGKNLITFSPKFVTCTATLQVTDKGNLLIQDTIEENHGLDSLSGMSGGPIIWSAKNRFGLAGIVRKGLDIQPKEGQLMIEDGILIYGERITPDIFEKWIEDLPPLLELKDETKSLYIPRGMEE